MSQILRVVTLGQKLSSILSPQAYRCTVRERLQHKPVDLAATRRCLLSTNTKVQAQKPRSHANRKRNKDKKTLVEDARADHFKELLSTIKNIKNTKSESLTADLSKENDVLGAQDRTKGSQDIAMEKWNKNLDGFNARMSRFSPDADSIGAKEQELKHFSEEHITSDRIKLQKSKIKFDTNKPMLNEAIDPDQALDRLPDVKTVGKKTSKKHKKTPQDHNKALLKLLSSHPFVEHMQLSENMEVEPELLKELCKILQDKSITHELRQNIQGYLARVQNLGQRDIGNFADVQSPESAFVDETVSSDCMEGLGESLSADKQGPLWTDCDINDPDKLKEITANVVKIFHTDLNKKAKQKAIQLDIQRRIDMYHREVTCYVDACIMTGQYKRAQTVLLGPSDKKTKKGRRKIHRPVTDVNIFNTLMHAFAKQGNLDANRQLFMYLETQGISPTLQSYGAILECLGRQKAIASDVVEKVIEDLETREYKIEDLPISCKLNADEWHCIEKTIQTVRPDFKARVKSIDDLTYDCKLLNHLNNDRMSTLNAYSGVITTEDLRAKVDQQISLELDDKVIVESIEPKIQINPQIKHARHLLANTKARWRNSLRYALKRNMNYLERREDYTTFNILPYMKLFPVDTYVDLMLQQIDLISQEMESFSPPMTYLHSRLGYRVYHRLVLRHKKKLKHVDKILGLYDSHIDHYNGESVTSNSRQYWQQLQHSEEISWDSPLTKWPVHVAKSVGRFLMSTIMAEIKVDANMFKETKDRSEIPAFYSVTRSRNNVPQEEIMPHPALVKLHKEAHVRELIFHPQDMPMSVPPVPWSSVDMGGNLLCTTDLIKNTPPQYDVHRKVDNQQLYPLFDALNTVSAVPWTINNEVLDVIIGVFNSGGEPSLDIPEPSSKCPPLPRYSADMLPEEKTNVIFERNRLNKKKKEMFSLWCTELYRLSIANKYRDEVFWFSHNIDFRSRFYAVPPHFNHLGSDVARSILVFAKGKPLGRDGLDWLKIHLVNLTGFKKRSSNKDRLAYAEEIMTEILDSADNPLDGRKWWQTSDEPWQTLACCMEIAKATRSPDSTKYECLFPVHQDGSCNGLQHYAALGRDQAGAESVNLQPFSAPKDVYSDVVELVEKHQQKDAMMGNKTAAILAGFIKRKVIKQTIMTTVYGVTKFGARQQIRGQLEDIPDFPQKYVWDAMFYLTDRTFYNLQQIFTSTKQIQDWLVLTAELISRIKYRPVEWVTPVGWPVLQPYHRHTYIRRPDRPDKSINVEKPNANKQKNAFPPNYIHSLDSTHMMLTAINCLQYGVMFVAVHDCFWTHASDITIMNKVCREQFVALHSEPILEDLAIFLLDKFGFSESEIHQETNRVGEAQRFVNEILGRVPERGTFEIDKVLDSIYFFS